MLFEHATQSGCVRFSQIGLMLLGAACTEMSRDELMNVMGIIVAGAEFPMGVVPSMSDLLKESVQGTVDRLDLESIPVAEV